MGRLAACLVAALVAFAPVSVRAQGWMQGGAISGASLGHPVFDPYAANSAPIGVAPLNPTGPLPPASCKRCRIFGDFLYLQPGSGARTDVAVPINGAVLPPLDPTVPIGPVISLNPEFDPGFRVGAGFGTNEISEWSGTYTYFRGTTSTSATAANSATVPIGPFDVVVLQPLVVHPATVAADTGFLDVAANSSIEFQFGDFEYRRLLVDNAMKVDWVLGGRYAKLDQDFNATYTNTTTVESVAADVQFDGGGVRLGLEGDFNARQTGFLVYGKGYSNFVVGKFRSSYTQSDNFSGPIVSTSSSDTRIVPILEVELGGGWESYTRAFRITGGYMFSAWFNAVTIPQYIDTVRFAAYNTQNDTIDTLTFNGLVVRGQLRF